MTAETMKPGGLAGLALVAFASLALADDDDEAKRMEGTWKFVSLTADGEATPQDFLQKARWTIRGKEILIPGPAEDGKASFTLDPTRSPKALDMTAMNGPFKGKTILCIYKLEGDRLTICLGGGKADEPGSRPRPEAFDGGAGRSLLVLERGKAE
jgi:RNA polymerase sigma-70 factor (ECF subfamily)